MEFESELTYVTIKQKLLSITKPLNYWNHLAEHQFFAKWNKDDSFYLMKTGSILSVRPILPFAGRIEVHDNSTYIVGGFTLTKGQKVLLTCSIGFVWILFLFACFFNNNFDKYGKIFIFVAISVWSLLLYLRFRYFTEAFQTNLQNEVIEFIKLHLLN